MRVLTASAGSDAGRKASAYLTREKVKGNKRQKEPTKSGAIEGSDKEVIARADDVQEQLLGVTD